MKYGFEMGSGAVLYIRIPSFIKIGPGIHKLIGVSTGTQTSWRSL
jgi:hypothetical protein